MSAQTPQSQANTQETQAEAKENSKEYNFRRQEQMYQRMLAEKEARLKEYEHAMQQKAQSSAKSDDSEDDDDSEPYVDHKKLKKQLNNFGQSTKSEIQKAMEQAKASAKEEIKREMWLENNPDFYEVLQHAEKFAEKSPKLAENILRMPDTFERQMLVYHNIKELGIHKPDQKQSSIQGKIDANRRTPYYQPPEMGTAPYASQSDFSPQGQKKAYEKLLEMKSRLRI